MPKGLCAPGLCRDVTKFKKKFLNIEMLVRNFQKKKSNQILNNFHLAQFENLLSPHVGNSISKARDAIFVKCI